MNRKMVFRILGQIIQLEALLLLLPTAVSIIYGESCVFDFLITIAIAIIVGSALILIFRPEKKHIYAKEGFVIVALSWVGLSAVGALPFVLSGEIPNYIDAFFETVSGFTTTGASIMNDVESMSHGILFWRSFTHWVGGMGVLVFIMAFVPSMCDRSIHIMRAEVPGPIVGKLVPTVKDTAKILYLIYIGVTVLEIGVLYFGGMFYSDGSMNLFESIVHSFGTAGTGGFGIKGDSIGGYNNFTQIVITVFMMLFGVNFNLYYFILLRRFKSVIKSHELWCYISIFAVSSVAIAINVLDKFDSFAESLKHSTFQVASIMTTTGYSTCNFDHWPTLSKCLIFILMFVGAMAGSTGGGLKISRLMILFKTVKRELKRMLHPRSVNSVSLDGKALDDNTTFGVLSYFALFMVLFFSAFIIVSFDGRFDFETNISAVASCINNIGPAFNKAFSSYAEFNPISKIVLTLSMLIGRLEIYPILFLFSRSTWSKKR